MTKQQEKCVKAEVKARLSAIISDPYEVEECTDNIINDVIADIDETADWSSIEDDEVILDDISISLSRVVVNKVTRGRYELQ